MAIRAESLEPKDGSTLALVEDLLGEARHAQKDYIRRWNRYYRMFRNQAWSQNRPKHLPSPQSPQIWPTIATLVAHMCVPESAEALTEDGWKRWDQIHPDDRFLTYNLEADEFEWQKAIRVSVFPFEGKLQNVRGFLATEDHRWPISSHHYGVRKIKRGYELKDLDRLIQTASTHSFPVESVLSPRDAAILGWVVTDGHFRIGANGSPNTTIYQSRKKYLNEIVALLGKEAGTVRTRQHELGEGSEVFVRVTAMRRIMAAGFRTKDDLVPIITRLSREAAEAMWDAMMKAEGQLRPDGNVYFCQEPGSPELEAFQVLSLLLGYRCNPTENYHHIVGGLGEKSGRFICARDISLEFYEGRIWCPTTPNGTWVMRQNGRVVITGNTDQFPDFYAAPCLNFQDMKTQPPEEILTERSADMQKLLKSWWITSGAHFQTQMSLKDALLYGCGILKTGLDVTKAGGLGEATMTRVDPYHILPDPQASCFEDARYVLEVRRVPMFEIIARFPERGHLVKPDGVSEDEWEREKLRSGPDLISSQQMSHSGVSGEWPGSAISGQPPMYGRPGKRRQDYTKSVRLTEAWIRGEDTIEVPIIEDGERKGTVEHTIPYWEFIAVANGIVLTPETSNPFDHGQLPYTRVPHDEIGEFWSMSMTEQLLPAQVALNRLLAATQISAELTGNPILIEPESSGLSRTRIVNRPGGRLTVNTGATQFIRWLDPPRMSQDVIQLISYWQDTIDRTSGITAVARGSQLRRREAAASVDAVRESSFARIQAVLRNYEEALKGVGAQIAANIVQFYIEPRIVALMGPEGGSGYLTLGHKHFYIPQVSEEGKLEEDVALNFDVWATSGSTLAMSRAARLAEGFELHKAGELPPGELLKTAQWPDAEKLTQQAQQAQQQAMMKEALDKSGGT